MARIVRADPYLTREDTGADEGRTPAVQHYEKQNGSDGQTGNTVFTLSKPYVDGSNTLLVFINGQKAELLVTATDETEYEETSSGTVTFGASLLDTDVVEFIVVGTYFIQDTDIYVTKALEERDNLIINGDMTIFQRGSSFTSPASGDFSADRWSMFKVGTMVTNVLVEADIPTVLESGHTSWVSLKHDVTTADAAIAAGDLYKATYKVEGHDARQLYDNYGTLSFWVKAVKAGIYCVSFRNSAGDRSYVVEYTINAASTWEKKTITVNFNESTGTWVQSTGTGIDIGFALACGSTYQTTADAWQTGAYLATSNQVNGVDSTDNNFWLSQVKLEKGQIATPFVSSPIADELTRCKRYFETFLRGASIVELSSGNNHSTTSIRSTLRYAEKRSEPTVTHSGTAGDFKSADTVGTHNFSALTFANASVNSVLMTGTTTGLTAGQGTRVYINTTTAYVWVDAEL